MIACEAAYQTGGEAMKIFLEANMFLQPPEFESQNSLDL
jgi:hypothetical protein